MKAQNTAELPTLKLRISMDDFPDNEHMADGIRLVVLKI
jgi:hypothetical protein